MLQRRCQGVWRFSFNCSRQARPCATALDQAVDGYACDHPWLPFIEKADEIMLRPSSFLSFLIRYNTRPDGQSNGV